MKKPNGYWNKERCYNVSKNFNSINELKNNEPTCYNTIIKNNWLNDMCSSMYRLIKPKNYWTYEKCVEESLKYKTKKELKNNSIGCYNKIIKNKWGEIMFNHMKPIGNSNKRIIYSYEFPNKNVYIGLTYNVKKRHEQHKIKGTVFKYFTKNNLSLPDMKLLTILIDSIESSKKEIEFIEKYRNDGWKIININNGGGLGGTKKWFKTKCQEVANKCESRLEFQKKYPGAYSSSIKNKWIDDITTHMISNKKNNDYWNYEKCKDEALKYDNRMEFQKKSSAYYIALKKGFLDEICKHMKTPISKITKKVIQLSLDDIFINQFNSLTEVSKKYKLSITNLSNCCNGKRKTCGGFKWKFVN